MIINLNEIPHLTSAEFDKLIIDTLQRINKREDVQFEAENTYRICSIHDIRKAFAMEGIAWSIPEVAIQK